MGEAAAKQDLAPWGYAPGTGLFHCVDCVGQRTCIDDALHKGHKHSTRCSSHALDAYYRDLRAGEAIYDPVEELIPPAEILQAERILVYPWVELAAIPAIFLAAAIWIW